MTHMLKERAEFIRSILYIADLLVISLSFFFIYFTFLHFREFYNYDLLPGVNVFKTPGSIGDYLKAYYLALVVWAVVLKARAEYHIRLQTYRKIIWNIFSNGLLFFGFFTSLGFLLKFEFLSRGFIIIYTGLSMVMILLGRFAVFSIAYYIRKGGRNSMNLLVVGTGRRTQDFLSLADQHKEWGYRIVGLLDRESEMTGKEVHGQKVIGTLNDLPKLLEKHVVDEVVFVVPRSWLKEIEKSILYCEAVGVPATLSTDFFDLEIASGVPKEMNGFTYITFETRRLRDPELLVKRTMDICLSGTVLLFMSLIFIVTAAVIKLTSKGPVFFSQRRSGRNGREFTLYKFRSMIPNAESKLDELQKFNEMKGPVFKMSNDPRLTGVGKFLRQMSLDEFPQFWNVLKGEMSLVGPRPPLPSEVKQYEPWQRRRLSMKPGITCIWQVSGRNEVDFEEWMKLDLQYIDRWSIWLDIKIILLTVKAVLTGRGAR